MAEIAHISDADIRITLHGSRGDSGQNEAEQTNSGVSNAICDGGIIDWETNKRFESMTNEEIDHLSDEQHNELKEQRDKRNAWSVSREIAKRIDGAPCIGEHIKPTTAIEPSEDFFWNKTFIERFYKTKSLAAKKEIPGYFYFSTIIAFDEPHTEGGEVIREFLKGDCEAKIGQL